MPSAYWEYSREVAGRFVNHNDMISEDAAGSSFRNTISVYEKSFRESYSLCFCWFGEASRHSEWPAEETVQTVENALETEIARRLNTGLLVNVAFTKVHCSKWACHPTMKSVLTDGEECEAECEAPGACKGKPWCEPDCDSGGCDDSHSRK